MFSNTIQGAFQRVGTVYPKHWNDDERIKFRFELRNKLDELAENYSTKDTSTDEHLKNLDYLTRCLEKWGLQNHSFGIAQKLLNLYLKYLWCIGDIHTPPHCPIDSRILAEVSKIQKVPKISSIPWSKMDRKTYESIINLIPNNISEWELDVFNDTNQYHALKKKCLCDNPDCAKCLVVNCEDDSCKTHTTKRKREQRRLRGLDSGSV